MNNASVTLPPMESIISDHVYMAGNIKDSSEIRQNGNVETLLRSDRMEMY